MRLFLGGGKANYTPPLSLLMLAAVTPNDVDLKIVDERMEEINFDEPVDLVGITVVTRSASRAYEIAAEFRSRGRIVVLGGIHPSALPEEASQHADSLVLGEGEGAWLQLLNDYRNAAVKPVYRGSPCQDLDALPMPRRDLLRHPEMYATLKVINATRGCLNTCSFCSAGVGLIKRYRERSIQRVMAELEQIPGRVAIFVDDNIGWDLQYAKNLLRATVPLHIKWSGSVSANVLEDPEFVELAARSGCTILSVGFESLSHEAIRNMRKHNTNDPGRYAALISRVHRSGIAVQGNFIVGFDEDDKSTFPALVDFINKTHIEIPWVSPLVPYPGSVLFRQYEAEGRLIHKVWDHYDTGGGQCVFLPKQMTPDELMEGFFNILSEVYSARSIATRLGRAGTWLSASVLATLHINLQYRLSIPTREHRVEKYNDVCCSELG